MPVELDPVVGEDLEIVLEVLTGLALGGIGEHRRGARRAPSPSRAGARAPRGPPGRTRRPRHRRRTRARRDRRAWNPARWSRCRGRNAARLRETPPARRARPRLVTRRYLLRSMPVISPPNSRSRPRNSNSVKRLARPVLVGRPDQGELIEFDIDRGVVADGGEARARGRPARGRARAWPWRRAASPRRCGRRSRRGPSIWPAAPWRPSRRCP